jgi:catechol 2,3-dioxygenase-like lactoylglutathione lyase family enzyme
MIKGLRHVGISVANIERALGFYRDLLGMQIVGQSNFSDEQYSRILGLKGAVGRVVLLGLADMQIELFEFAQPVPTPGNPRRPVCDHGITHICIEVGDIESEYQRLKVAGVEFHCPPLEFFGTVKATYGRDPDGNVLELTQTLTTDIPE